MILQQSACLTSSSCISEQATIQNNKHGTKLFQVDKENTVSFTSLNQLSVAITFSCSEYPVPRIAWILISALASPTSYVSFGNAT